jgi:hypothetical protein
MNKKQRGRIILATLVAFVLIVAPFRFINWLGGTILAFVAVVYALKAVVYWYEDGDLVAYWKEVKKEFDFL